MAEFPYTNVTGKLLNFFEKIQGMGVPNTVNTKWLPTIGFTSKNDRSIVTLLKFIGFIDASGKPTQRWLDYRDKSRAKKVMASAILHGYGELFRVYPDAHARSDEDLKNIFRSKTTAGNEVIEKTTATFKALCKVADFSETDVISASNATAPTPNIAIQPQPISYPENQSGVTININIEFSLPATTDEKVYDNLFSALKRHILSGERFSGN
jgi:hypothetical protein